ncbi:ureidoglycolate hydrolase [Kalaharituber pfeilii]|nr:ureidoglycolate hydrolase [Kalaharituber pfeilii]
MPLSTIDPPRSSTVRAVPLTPSAFSPFGTVISNPGTSGAVLVNQGTAQKHTRITPFTNNYPLTSPTPPGAGAPHSDATLGNGSTSGIFKVQILERHPYTTQSFIPLGIPPPSRALPSPPRFLVVVAPSLDAPGNPPDLRNLKAFITYGNQGVTYGAGTWHGPMVVLGDKPIEFVVLVHENGVSQEDCQEVNIGGQGVDVEISGIIGTGEGELWGNGIEKAKI